MKVYVVIAKWSTEEGHDYELLCTTADRTTAVTTMNEDFNNRIEDEELSEEDGGYEFVRKENSCEYWSNYSYDEYCVTIHERELV